MATKIDKYFSQNKQSKNKLNITSKYFSNYTRELKFRNKNGRQIFVN